MRNMPLAVALGLGLVAVSTSLHASAGIQLTPTQAEIQTIIARYPMQTGSAVNRQLEEIVVTAPIEVLPVRDPTRDIWEGIAAPFWAMLHPTQAWRIFLPIPSE